VQSTIHGLFPTPIYITKLTRQFSNKENKFIEKSKLDTYKNEGNLTSNDNCILNSKTFISLKKELDEIIKDYFNKVISPSNNIKPYITQSWLNYTEQTQYHHTHAHPNSLVSGVLYINADKDNDKIKFFKPMYQIIKPEIKEYNLYNSETWWFPVETLDVVLFPSSLTHRVEVKQGTNTRISLAFNTFIKGTVGDNKKLTELRL
tara:strand:+ start:824 stop:1435 length:612 start_codon:yes stop_codon:yes gene_type:complete